MERSPPDLVGCRQLNLTSVCWVTKAEITPPEWRPYLGCPPSSHSNRVVLKTTPRGML